MNNVNEYFFNNIGESEFQSSSIFAKEYLKFTIDNPQNINTDHSVLLFNDENDLEFITKRAMLISNGITFSCKTPKSIRIDVDYSETKEGLGYYVHNNSLQKLGDWLVKTKNLLLNNKIMYYPNIYSCNYSYDEFGVYGVHDITNILNVSNAIESSGKLVDFSDNLKENFFNPIMQLQIPVLDSVNLENFCNIIIENIDSYNRFQNYLRNSLLSSSNFNSTKMATLSYDLQLQLNDLSNKYKSTINRFKINALITGVFTISAILVAIYPNVHRLIEQFSHIGTILGTSIYTSYDNFVVSKQEINGNNVYFLWLLENKR